MKMKELLEEVNKELIDEVSIKAKEIIKTKQKEIQAAKRTLAKLENSFNDLLDKDIEEFVEDDEFEY